MLSSVSDGWNNIVNRLNSKLIGKWWNGYHTGLIHLCFEFESRLAYQKFGPVAELVDAADLDIVVRVP